MKVAELLRSRRENWRELEGLCAQLESKRRRTVPPATLTRFAALYRAACADLALAEGHQLPPGTVQYLHRLVGRTHNQLYRSRAFNFQAMRRQLFEKVPRRLLGDPCVWLAFAIFWGIFVLALLLGAETKMPWNGRPLAPGFAERLVGEKELHEMEEMYSGHPFGRDGDLNARQAAFYIAHNTGIGLKCFAAGLLFGVGGLFALVFNAAHLGAVFGFMLRPGESRANFIEFVTAHGPFELTAIILSAAAGMRVGFALIFTKGRTRMDALAETLKLVVPTLVAAVLLFIGAAFIEGFVSISDMGPLVAVAEWLHRRGISTLIPPKQIPFAVKAIVGVASSALLVSYFVLLGFRPGEDNDATDDAKETEYAVRHEDTEALATA